MAAVTLQIQELSWDRMAFTKDLPDQAARDKFLQRQQVVSKGYLQVLWEDGKIKAADILPEDVLRTGAWTLLDPPAGTSITGRLLKYREGNGESNDQNLIVIGNRIFDWLLPAGPIRDYWNQLPGTPALSLDIQPSALAQMPWELACTPAPALTRVAVVNKLLRLAITPKAQPQCSCWPFRILVVVGCSPEDEKALGVDKEVAAIDRRFLPLGRSVDVHIMRRPAKDDMMKWIGRHHPHVLHFAGHGGEHPTSGTSGLLFELPNNESWVWSPGSIDTDLRRLGWRPRFVFLNNCRSAFPDPAHPELGWNRNVQQSFRAHAGAVLAMQADIAGSLAGLLAASIYEECVAGKTVAEALHEGRGTLWDEVGAAQVDWAIPSLVTSDPEMKLFDPREPVREDGFEECEEFEEARYIGNCREQRRDGTAWMYPVAPSDSDWSNVLVIKGEPKSGKSHLLKWLMESWALGGARVRYIEVHDPRKPKDFLDLIRQTKNGELGGDSDDARKYLHGPLPENAFRRFHWELNNILKLGVVGEWDPAQQGNNAIPDSGLPPTAKGEDRIEPKICQSFLRALQAMEPERKLILVLDRLSGEERPGGAQRFFSPEEFKSLRDNLFIPIAQDRTSKIKLVFSVSSGEWSDFGLAKLPRTTVIPVKSDYRNEDLTNYAVEMLWYNDEAYVRQIAEILWMRPRSARGLVLLGFVREALKDTEILRQVERMK